MKDKRTKSELVASLDTASETMDSQRSQIARLAREKEHAERNRNAAINEAKKMFDDIDRVRDAMRIEIEVNHPGFSIHASERYGHDGQRIEGPEEPRPVRLLRCLSEMLPDRVPF